MFFFFFLIRSRHCQQHVLWSFLRGAVLWMIRRTTSLSQLAMEFFFFCLFSSNVDACPNLLQSSEAYRSSPIFPRSRYLDNQFRYLRREKQIFHFLVAEAYRSPTLFQGIEYLDDQSRIFAWKCPLTFLGKQPSTVRHPPREIDMALQVLWNY